MKKVSFDGGRCSNLYLLWCFVLFKCMHYAFWQTSAALFTFLLSTLINSAYIRPVKQHIIQECVLWVEGKGLEKV